MIDPIAKYASNEWAFLSNTDLITIATTNETPLLYIKNPPGSAKNILLTHFLVGTDSASARSTFKIYCDPTSSADGTALEEINTYLKTSPKTSSMTAFKSPTVSANGILVHVRNIPSNSESRGINRFFWLAPGHEVLVTVQNSAANAKSFAEAFWIEGL